jgi:hypothetical protein
MAVYLYAICREDAVAPDASGFGGRPLRMVRSHGLSALVSDCDRALDSASEEELWEHERVVEALMSASDLIPARFGAVLESDAAVADLISARCEEFRAAIDFVAGAAELGVRATCVTDSAGAPEATPGVAYFADKLDARQRLRVLGDRVDAALAPLAKARKLRMPGPADATIAAAYLVARDRIENFAARAAELDAALSEGAVICTGPWPPYSFTDARCRA